jgi:hypothetical protein
MTRSPRYDGLTMDDGVAFALSLRNKYWIERWEGGKIVLRNSDGYGLRVHQRPHVHHPGRDGEGLPDRLPPGQLRRELRAVVLALAPLSRSTIKSQQSGHELRGHFAAFATLPTGPPLGRPV